MSPSLRTSFTAILVMVLFVFRIIETLCEVYTTEQEIDSVYWTNLKIHIFILYLAVRFICEHPDIQAISFVGSDKAVSTWK